MIPIKLEISGFLSYQSKEVLDFNSFDLACITGDNGAGKSSILDAITWSLFGKARKSDDSIINLQSDEARVTFTFHYEDILYKVDRINPRGDTKVVYFYAKEEEEHWIDLSERTMRTTDDKICRTLGIDYETFVNVSFFLQGKADQFTQQTPGNRKQILSQILGLDEWQEYKLEASRRRRQKDAELRKLEGRIEELSSDLYDEKDLKLQIKELKDLLKEHTEVVKKNLERLENAKTLHSVLDSQKQMLRERQISIDKMLTNLKSLRKKLDERIDERDAGYKILNNKDDIEAKYKKWSEDSKRLEYLEELSDNYHSLKGQQLDMIEAMAAEVIMYASERKELEQKIENFDEDILQDSQVIIMNNKLEGLKELKDACPTCGRDLPEDVHSDLMLAFDVELKNYISRAHKLFMKTAKKNIERLKELEEKAKDDDGAAEKLKARIEALEYNEEEHEFIEASVRRDKGIQQQFMILSTTEARLEPIVREIKDLEKQVMAAEDEVEISINLMEEESDRLDEVMSALPDIDHIQKGYDLSKEVEAATTQKLGGAKEKLKTLQDIKSRLTELKTKRENIAQDTEILIQLEEAFGKDGIPALLIEQALPQIEDRANSILYRLSGGTMSVRFITQREYKDEKRKDKKETLDIQIQDESGVRDYEMYSGGESFRINFAVRLALSFVLAQRSGARIQTLVIDEGFGSQDSIGKERLIEAINLIREDFEKILIITHVDYLKEVFTNQIFVEKNMTGSHITVL